MKRRGTTPTVVSSTVGNDWRQNAACTGEDTETFFSDTATAKAICHTCPVMQECVQWALDARIEYGVWGGLDEDERRHQLRRTGDIKTRGGGRTPAPCGTRAAYDRHLRKGEPIDRLCATQGRYSNDKDMAA